MKTIKLILGILSGVLFIIIMLQLCAMTVGDALVENGGASGIGGIMLSFCVLIGGVVGAAARNSRAGAIVAAVFYLIGAFFGFVADGGVVLNVWAVLSAALGVFFIISAVVMKTQKKTEKKEAEGV